jgi:predicted phosphohydrolase
MALFALGDLHLSFANPKPMEIFGSVWNRHEEKIARGWQRVIGPKDLVIIPGDISWALRLAEAVPDLNWLGGLLGQKLLIRGNHDYWWSGIGKVRNALPAGVFALQNDHFPWGELAICGSRGWIVPGDKMYEPEQDDRIYKRELERLELSLASAVKAGYKQLVVALHYPPVNTKHEPSGFTELFCRYPVIKCLYGHLHGEAQHSALVGQWQGVEYFFVAADAVYFTPVLIHD